MTTWAAPQTDGLQLNLPDEKKTKAVKWQKEVLDVSSDT